MRLALFLCTTETVSPDVRPPKPGEIRPGLSPNRRLFPPGLSPLSPAAVSEYGSRPPVFSGISGKQRNGDAEGANQPNQTKRDTRGKKLRYNCPTSGPGRPGENIRINGRLIPTGQVSVPHEPGQKARYIPFGVIAAGTAFGPSSPSRPWHKEKKNQYIVLDGQVSCPLAFSFLSFSPPSSRYAPSPRNFLLGDHIFCMSFATSSFQKQANRALELSIPGFPCASFTFVKSGGKKHPSPAKAAYDVPVRTSPGHGGRAAGGLTKPLTVPAFTTLTKEKRARSKATSNPLEKS